MVKRGGGGQSTKSGPVTSAAVFKGNVVPVVTVSRGMKTKGHDAREYQAGKGSDATAGAEP